MLPLKGLGSGWAVWRVISREELGGGRMTTGMLGSRRRCWRWLSLQGPSGHGALRRRGAWALAHRADPKAEWGPRPHRAPCGLCSSGRVRPQSAGSPAPRQHLSPCPPLRPGSWQAEAGRSPGAGCPGGPRWKGARATRPHLLSKSPTRRPASTSACAQNRLAECPRPSTALL